MRNKAEYGQSLLEVTITIGVSVLIITALVITTLTGLKNSQLAQNQSQATKLAQEGLETVKAFKINNTPINIGGTDYTWYGTSGTIWGHSFSSTSNPNCNDTCSFMLTTCPANCRLVQIPFNQPGESIPNSQFKRKILIEDTTDNNKKKVTSIVSWADSSGTHQSNLATYIANF